jgi:phosphoglycolate phosphatase-like HAD superfamily hydrolase
VAHLVWDWNGTLLDDLSLVVTATNASLASVGGPSVTADEHRRDFRRPISEYYAYVLRRPVTDEEFVRLDGVFHEAYRDGLPTIGLAPDAWDAITAWDGTQSLLSMWFHHELVPLVATHGLRERLSRVDGLRASIGGGSKAPHLRAHLDALGMAGPECVLIGDSVDDAHAAESVGAAVVLYAGGFTHPEALRATGRPVAASLLEAVTLAVAAPARSAGPVGEFSAVRPPGVTSGGR